MRPTYSDNATGLPIAEEKRRETRYDIDCPVTVLTPGRGKKQVLGCGRLCDISDKGARFILDSPLEVGHRISLEVDFQHPDGKITTIRFPGIVKRVSPGEMHEIAVSLLRGETYIRGKGSRAKSKDSPWNRVTKGSKWIN